MLGYSLQEIEFNVKSWDTLIHNDDRASAWKSINDHLAGITAMHSVDYRMRCKDGQWKWISDRAKIVEYGADGKPVRMSGTHQDITGQKHLEEKLWELRLTGRDGIARALYVTAVGRRVIVVRAFVKKTQKTPPGEIKLALQRAKEIT